MTDAAPEPAAAEEADLGKVVPLAESIRYRRRAQQAEKRAEQLEQQLRDAQAQMQTRLDELAAAEAQRDELADQFARARHQRRLERALEEFGVQDTEAALLLLEKSGQAPLDADDSAVQTAVERLVLDRPHLCGQGQPPLPGATAPARQRGGARAELASAARQAIRTGARRDVAAYLRLRRQCATE